MTKILFKWKTICNQVLIKINSKLKIITQTIIHLQKQVLNKIKSIKKSYKEIFQSIISENNSKLLF